MKRTPLLVCALAVFMLLALPAQKAAAQRISLKTNALLWATASPNIGAEFRLSRHFTLNAEVAGNPFSVGSYKPTFAAVSPELRYWFSGRPQARFFVGLGGLFSEYAMQLKNDYHDGQAFGAGVTGGYSFVLGRRWSLETTLGVGLLSFREKNYRVGEPAPASPNREVLTVAPIKAGVTFVYILK